MTSAEREPQKNWAQKIGKKIIFGRIVQIVLVRLLQHQQQQESESTIKLCINLGKVQKL